MIQIKLKKYTNGRAIMDSHPIDDDYCDTAEIVSELEFTVNGESYRTTGNSKDTTKEELTAKAVKSVAFEVWYEENWLKCFTDFGLEAPVVYDHEEGTSKVVNDIDNFVNNCIFSKNYDAVMRRLYELAFKDVSVEVIDET